MNQLLNQVAWMTALQRMEIQDAPMPTPDADDVLVQLEYVGICGSDMHFFEMGGMGDYQITYPVVLGHETAGTVIATGANVSGLHVGDRVCLEPGVPCGHCDFCKSGRYNICPDVKFMAAPPFFDGALRKYIAYPAQWAYKLPDQMGTLEGAMVEPLSVGFHAALRGGAAFGKKAVILGAGTIGLMTLAACIAMGMGDVMITDMLDSRLALATRLGAKYVVNAKDRNTSDAVAEFTGGMGADIVFEAAGSRATLSTAPHLIKAGGTIVLVGNTVGEVPFDFFKLMMKEVDIRTVFRYRNIYPMVIDAIANGLVDIRQVITHTFDFADTQKAFDFAIHNKAEIVKGVIRVS